MQFNRKVHANSPALTAGSGVLNLPLTAVGGSSLTAAIAAANPAGNIDEINGLRISASNANPVYIRSSTGANNTGILIPTGQNLFLPIAEWPAVELDYQCAGTVDVMVFLARMPRFNNT